MDRLLVLSILAGLVAIGWLSLRHELQELLNRQQFLEGFLEDFQSWIRSGSPGNELYGRLLERSPQMQTEMGGHGTMAGYRPPFANYMIPNYAIILNMLPEIRQHASDHVMRNLTDQYASSVQEALFRYRGVLNRAVERSRSSLKNPLRVLRAGVQLLLTSPLLILHWLGVGSPPSIAGGGLLIRLGSAILTILAVASAIVSLVLGWGDFWQILRSLG